MADVEEDSEDDVMKKCPEQDVPEEPNPDQVDEEATLCKIVPDWDRNSRPTEVAEKSTDDIETEFEKGEGTSSILSSHETDDDAKIQSNEQFTSAAWEGMLPRASICPTDDAKTIDEFQQYLPEPETKHEIYLPDEGS